MKLSSKYFIVTKQRSLKWYIIGDGMTFMVMPAKSLMATNYVNFKKSSLCYYHLSIKMSKMSTRSTTELTQSFLILRICHKNIQSYSWLEWKFTFVQFFSYRKEFGSNLPGEEIVNRRSQNPWLPLVQAIEQQGQITCIPILWRTLLRPLCLQTKPRYTLSDNNQHHHHENDLSFTIPIKINYWFLWHCICLQT